MRLVRTTLNLKQYQCQKCGLLFYTDKDFDHEFNMDFDCPRGCDDAAKHVRTFETEIKSVEDVPQEDNVEEE